MKDADGSAAEHRSAQAVGPLAGIRVLDLGFVYAAPIAAMLLGDYGADVVKIESPAGDPARSHGWTKEGHGLWWKVIARNKRTATLDLRKPAGQDVLRRLVAQADVLVENFRPGVLESWGLGPEQLREINPRLVMLRVSGFGQTGPYAGRRAFGTLAEAMSGFAHQTGPADGPPTLPPFGLADGVTGVAGALAVTLALYHRQLTGRGQVIDISLLEPLLGILGPAVTVYDQLGVIPSRNGNRSPNNAPRNVYETRDGRWVAVSASATNIARRVMRLVGHEAVTREPWFDKAGERAARVELLDTCVADWIKQRDMCDVLDSFERVGAAIVPIYDVSELVADQHVREREVVTTLSDEDLGPLLMQNVMFRLSETPGGIRSTGRRLGQDNDEVYAGLLGMAAEEIEQLRLAGVI